MSTRNQTPVGLGILLLLSVSVIVALIANELLGHLATTQAAPTGLGYWQPLLAYGIPVVAFAGVSVFVWLSASSSR